MPQKDRAGLPPESVEVRRLIAKGNSKSALDAAKQLYKSQPTPATEAVLVEAYLARARSLMDHDMDQEAEALLAMVRERYPLSVGLLNAALPPQGTRLEELVRPLADPALAEEKRAAIERELRATMADPGALAACGALPPDQPLRAGARLVSKALAAATSGPVDDAVLELREISRRSPLAPWKPLLRAIACFYGHDDAGCERNLAAIDADSAPARLAPVLRSLIAQEAGDGLKPAAANLAKRVGGSLAGLCEALQNLETAVIEDDQRVVLQAVREAVSFAQQDCPEIVPSLRQQIAVRGWLMDLPAAALNAAIGGAPRRDARYLLLAARAMEVQEGGEIEACMAWDDFREAAVKEGWFPVKSPEAAAVYLRMAGLIGRADDEDIDSIHGQARAMVQQMLGDELPLPDTALPQMHAEWLYEQACGMDPHAEAFAAWLKWEENRKEGSAPQSVAEAWHAALPADPRPLLWLMRDAESRGALKKALGYLGEAEAVDGLNPEVRRARLRLLLRGAIRHLDQRKPRLAFRELDELDALPYAAEGDRPAFLAGLRYVAAVVAGDHEAALARATEVQSMLGGRAAAFALAGVNSLCGQPAGVQLETARGFEGSWVEAAARVVAMGRDVGFHFRLPANWEPDLREELRGGLKASVPALEVFGEAAVESGWRELAYAASVHGMAAGAEHEARFLVLRAQALPDWEGERRDECLAAAIELARRQGDAALSGKAVELRRRYSFLGFDYGGLLSERGAKTVLERERRQRQYPCSRGRWDDSFFAPPRPRRRRKKKRGPRTPASGQEEMF